MVKRLYSLITNIAIIYNYSNKKDCQGRIDGLGRLLVGTEKTVDRLENMIWVEG